MMTQPQRISQGTTTHLAGLALGVSQKYWRVVVIAMLVLLHVVVLRGVADNWARPLLLAHLGLLLIWQPFFRGEQPVSLTQFSLIALGATAVMLWLNAWLLVFWVCVLAGLVGGKVFLHQSPWQRRFYLLVLFYLVALLAILILPDIAPRREISPEVREFAEFGLPVLFVILGLIPVESDSPEAPQVIDFFYSIFLVLVLGVVILGSFTFMTLGRMNYLEALTNIVFLIAGTVLVVGLAWSPRTGFAGLNVLFSRYLFSIGLPVEKWLHFLAELSQLERQPERFLAEGVSGLVRLPWVSGAHWRTSADQGEHGKHSAFPVTFQNDEVKLTIYSAHRTSPALSWHLQLLGQLLAEFYVGKVREQKLQEQSYIQAVHETGARVTHDVKNLLQSLNVMVSLASKEAGREYSPELQALIGRQLPVVAQRLSATLDKLQRPDAHSEEIVSAIEWWRRLGREYYGRGIEFVQCEESGGKNSLYVPKALVDSVLDNLLQNAMLKRQADPSVLIRCTLEAGPEFTLRVVDTGSAVPAEVESLLMRSPVPSRTGLGIGLLHAAKQAHASGFQLSLEKNVDGEVAFLLTGPATNR